MIPPMYDVQEYLAYMLVGQQPPGDFTSRMLLYLKYQFTVLITFWGTRKSRSTLSAPELSSHALST
jgi:hypothetical protein